jgi:hypothetical protein
MGVRFAAGVSLSPYTCTSGCYLLLGNETSGPDSPTACLVARWVGWSGFDPRFWDGSNPIYVWFIFWVSSPIFCLV